MIRSHMLAPGWPPAIVVALDASAAEQQAAQLLATWCGKLGAWSNNCQHCPLPIVTPAAATGKPQFAVGVAATAALGLSASDLALDALGVDGYVLTTNRTALLRASAGSVALSGAPNSTGVMVQQGTIYAALHLLRLLGVEFMAWDETLLPSSAPVLGEVDLTFRPQFEYRYVYGWASDHGNTTDKYGHAPIHTRFHQSADPYVSPPGPTHTSYTLFGPDHPPGPNCSKPGCTGPKPGRDCCPPADIFHEHKEWFWPRDDGKSDGQLCWSNASMVVYITERVAEMLEMRAAESQSPTQYWVVSISQNDNGLYCKSAEELAVIDAEGSPMGPLLLAVNAIAKALAPRFPNVTFSTLAYQYTRPPPKSVRPEPNVIVQLCEDSNTAANGNSAAPLTDPSVSKGNS